MKTWIGALVLAAIAGGPAAAQQACGDGEAALAGHLSDAGVALPGVEITVSWTRAGDAHTANATTGLDGGFRFCLPTDASDVRAWAALGDMRGQAVEVAWPASEEIALSLGIQGGESPVDAASVETGLEAGDGGAGIRGTILDPTAERPISGARVDLDDAQGVAITDETGSFILRTVTPGDHVLRVEHLGYQPLTESVSTRVGQTTALRIELAPQAVAAEPIVVSVFRDSRLDKLGFYERKERGELLGLGEFMTREEIQQTGTPRVSGLLDRFRGIDMIRFCAATCLLIPRVTGAPPRFSASRGANPTPCPADVYIDGTRVRLWRWTAAQTLDVIAGIDEFLIPTSVGGIEVYRRASELPPEFGGATDGCGAVVIWTR